MRNRILQLILCVLLIAPAWGRVLARWTHGQVPSAQKLGIRDIAIPWRNDAAPLIGLARERGYQVYVIVPLNDALKTAASVSRQPVAGVILDKEHTKPEDVAAALKSMGEAYPKLTVLLMDSNGKEPQMRGQTVTTRDGVLQVSSPTAQPWLDSNLALVRFDEAINSEQSRLYTFEWEAGDSVRAANGPSAEDYALAIAEANAIHADLVVPLDEKLQKGLAANEPGAWELWSRIKPLLTFASGGSAGARTRALLNSDNSSKLNPSWSNVGIITDDFESAYEPMNLMGRHNIPFRVLRSTSLAARELEGLDVVAVFTVDQRAPAILADFAQRGGTAVLVNLNGNFPWRSSPRVQSADHASLYAVGKGRIIELEEPVGDPETFAQDIRRLIPKENVLISLWNALTTIAVPYQTAAENVVEMVNYSAEPLKIQMRLKGRYSSIIYESPEQSPRALASTQHDGFTEFVIPALRIAGRVWLRDERERKQNSTSH